MSKYSVEARILRNMKRIIKAKRNQLQPVYKTLLAKDERYHTQDAPDGSVGELTEDWVFYG